MSVDTREENARFAEKFRFPFPLIGDAERKICMAYGACDSASDQYARRIAYVIDHNGRIDEAFDKVDARQFPHEVLEKV